jgi:GNAT superfamily N-acetyltransferase
MLLSQDVADRVERADRDYLVVRVGALAGEPGNPAGAQVRAVGDAHALLVASVPNPVFNAVLGLTARDAAALPELAGWYASHGLPLRVHVTPAQADPALFDAMAALGVRQTGFYGGLFARPAVTEPVAGVTVEEADPAEFAQVYVRGFGFPGARTAVMARSIEVLAGRPECRFFRARTGAATEGVGLLFLANGTGYLATAATLPESRGRGVQTALVRHRIGVSAAAGADLVVGHTAFGSGSQRTMERCGLHVAYTKAIWTARTPGK